MLARHVQQYRGGFGTPEQVKKSAGEAIVRTEEEQDHVDQRRGGRDWKDPLCPSWDCKGLSEWPEKRVAIDQWSKLTATPPEEQGATLLLLLHASD